MASPSALDKKIGHWRQNLLDMTLRNRLLNFKPRYAVHIVRPDPGTMFDLLVRDERTLTVREMAEEESSMPAEGIELAGNEVLPAYDPKGLWEGLRRMRLKARAHLQEQGVNILYMAFGLVRWYEAGNSRDEHLSPLVLVPIELVKEGPLHPFKLRAIDEDVVVNPNLAFMLSTDYKLSLPEWPEEPVTLDEYLVTARRSLSAMPAWSIDAEAYLGLFTFAKLSMYRELVDERDRLAAHPFINALAGDQSMLPLVPEHPTAATLDASVHPEDTFQILDADSSQQEAIEMAKRGISFVLQGPPGTGKSQTIANIIAESLAADRKVMFVSEKMAALEVVKKRLDDKGLGDFILEIHSGKASKVAVMDELRRSMMPLPMEPVAIDDLQRLERAREELDGYVDALHGPRGKMGRSAFHVHGRLAALAGMPDLPVRVSDAMALGLADLDDRLKLVRRIEAMRASVERMDTHPWKDLRTSGWKPGDEVTIASSLQELRDSIAGLTTVCSDLCARSGMGAPANMSEATKLVDLMRRASATPFPEASWFMAGRPEELLTNISALQELYSRRAYDRRWLADNYAEEVLSLDVHGMSSRFDLQYRGLLRSLKGRYRSDMAQLQRLRRNGRRASYAEASADLRKLAAIDDLLKRTEAAEASVSKDVGQRFKGEATDWDELVSSLQWSSRFMSDAGPALAPRMVELLSDRNGGASELAQPVERAEAELRDLSRSLEWLERTFVVGPPGTLGTTPFEKIDGMAVDHLANLPSIKEWVEASALDAACRENGLAEVIDLGRKKGLPAGDLAGAYEKRALRAWLDQARYEDPRLRDFRSDEHAQTIALFRRLDEKQLDIARKRLRNMLILRREQALRPQTSSSRELGVLRHEAAKKKRFKQIRQLFQECPQVIQALKPCLLMSPLSVSQYLDPKAVSFDLVIFDEASQVRPEDAIGSIMRARQVIVVGDNKQLPPTSFFRGEAGDEDEAAEDLESILDECTALNIRQQMLLWHYRSRHESLIAFSNRHIYDGRLFTFPSPGREEGEWGVSLVRVPDGVYDRAGTRANPVEARKVAELVFEHFSRSPERSLGVVAFSEAQQMAILDQLEAMRKERPEYEKFFAEGGLQEFFVKNLENVQGDERDVMIFSVGYGRDAQGKMYQNFGPLNKAGGERRLNVAITRAKMHVKLVASIGAEDIEGASSAGARLLRDYLAYAASGGSREALQDGKERRYQPEADSPLEDEIYKVLTAEGLRLQRRVGCSGYRIDLAVEDPARPGSFLLGIECDGASYRSGRTARDRDRTREAVLRGLRWKLHRIWSWDWITDRDKEVEKVKRALASAGAPEDVSAPAEQGAAADGPGRLEKESFRPALLDLVRSHGPVHQDVARDMLDDHVHRPEDADRVLSEHLYALTTNGTLVVRDGFIWPADMTAPPVRQPAGREPMALEYVSLEEIGEAELYNMGGNTEISRDMLIERTAAFYRHERLSDHARERLELALDMLIDSRRLVPHGKGLLRRAR